MALGQALQQKQLLKLLPQQIQLMKLLQVPTANLEERIKEELEENPALEVNEDDSRDEADLEGQEALSDYELAGDSDDDDQERCNREQREVSNCRTAAKGLMF